MALLIDTAASIGEQRVMHRPGKPFLFGLLAAYALYQVGTWGAYTLDAVGCFMYR